MSTDEEVRRVWTLGSYPDVGPTFLPMAADLVETVGVDPGDAVLDVACGTGNVAITAARRGADVTGLDITPAMLEAARENAALAGVTDVDWHEGDATDLPFADDAFDVTLSCVGHMFANPPEAAARELVRVTRSDGRLGFSSWTPTSVVPAMAKVMQSYLPPDPGSPEPPFMWGDPDVVRGRLGDGVADVSFTTGTVRHVAMSPAHIWEEVRNQSGMFIVALEAVDETDRAALDDEMVAAIEPFFEESENAMVMEYRLTTARVR